MIRSEDTVVIENVTCEFPGTRALNSVSLTFLSGETHAITGENGAGKSTLLKVLAGVVQPRSGRIHIQGQSVRAIRESWKLGIRTIPQEPLLAPALSIAENVFLGRLPFEWRLRVNWPLAISKATELLETVGLSHLDPRRPVRGLEIGEQQLIQTARALVGGGTIFLFDEPTSTLTSREVSKLTAVIRNLTARGAIVLFVSHRMAEIFSICDRVSVLRDGNHVSTEKITETTPDKLVRAMVGRNISGSKSSVPGLPRQVSLSVRNLSMDPARGSIDLDVRRGEIVGLAGLVGCGAKALLESIFGIREHSGQTAVDGKPARIRSPRDAMKAGIGFVPQDRKRDGLIPALPIEENLALSNFPILSRFCVLLRARKRRFSLEWISRLRIKCTGPLQPVRLLSGGNQQKVVLAKWLARNPTALLLDEPTRGVDIGAKAEIHEIIRALTERGVAILLASSEMPELLQLCDRVLVMREGHMISELRGQEMTEETILRHAVPGVQTISR